MKFSENHPKGSGDTERTQKCYGQNDRQRKGIPIAPLPLCGGGLKSGEQCSA